MTALERHARWLLRTYPALHRRERGEEIVGTLLEAPPEGRTWPPIRDVRALAVGGMKARAAENQQLTVGANLRVAVMAGLAIFVSIWAAAYLYVVMQAFVPSSVHLAGWLYWPATASGLLGGATVVLAWTAPRAVALACALAASAGEVAFAWGPVAVFGPHLLDVLSVLGLAALAPRAGHPSKHWLWLPGAFVAWRVLTLGHIWATVGYTWQQWTPGFPMVALVVGAILWVGVDARLIIALLMYFTIDWLQGPVAQISYGVHGVVLGSLPFLFVLAALMALSVWLLRRQSARAVR